MEKRMYFQVVLQVFCLSNCVLRARLLHPQQLKREYGKCCVAGDLLFTREVRNAAYS